MSRTQATKSASSAGKVVRLAVAIVVVAATGFFLYHAYQQRQIAHEYNRIVGELVNQQQYEQGYNELSAMLGRVDDAMADRIKGDMALCAKALADDPTKPLAASAAWYRKAYEADPTSLNERQMREMQLGEKLP